MCSQPRTHSLQACLSCKLFGSQMLKLRFRYVARLVYVVAAVIVTFDQFETVSYKYSVIWRNKANQLFLPFPALVTVSRQADIHIDRQHLCAPGLLSFRHHLLWPRLHVS